MDTQDRARTDGEIPALNGAVADAAGQDASIGLGLITRDLARALGAGMALLARAGHTLKDVEMLAAWGPTASHDGLPFRLEADGFVGRALGVERTTVEPLGRLDARRLGVPEREASLSDVLIAPVRPPSGPAAVLCAVFSADPPHAPETTAWLADSYARLAALCLHDPQALDGLLSGGRTDGLTGCLTQAAVVQELHRELARSDRHERPLSCSFIDLDHFKRVNDRYGHLHGSRVLANVAAVIGAGIRSEDTLGRYGGDEFVVLLPDTDEQAALELSERLRATIARTTINLPHDPIDASIGVAQWCPGSPATSILAEADKALLAAKAYGGGTVISASALTLVGAERSGAGHDDRVLAEISEMASIQDVLDVTSQFDRSGGASAELVAWELDLELALVISAWSRAIRTRLLDPAGTDPGTGEEMWRLTDLGRLELSSPVVQLAQPAPEVRVT